MWNNGGLCFVTSRILIVDMLNGLIPWHKLGGIIYFMTPRSMIKENCTENFILRVYAQHVFAAKRKAEYEAIHGVQRTSASLGANAVAFDGYNATQVPSSRPADLSTKLFIKAFTESASVIAHGWNRLEKVAHALKVGNKIHIWPRFRKPVSSFLNAHQPETLQYHVHLAPIQEKIHTNLISIFKQCVDDLRQRCRGTQIGQFSIGGGTDPTLQESDISYEKALFSNFYNWIHSILEPLGDKVPRKIRSLIADLNLLRELIMTLIRCDAVKFYEKFHKLLREQSFSDGSASLDWLHYKEADAVAALSQERLWRTPPTSASKSAPASGNKEMDAKQNFEAPPLTLEDNPKWRTLLQVLHEIEVENSNEALGLGTQPIVIIVRDVETRHALAEYLALPDPSHYLLSKLKKHVLTKVETFRLNRLQKKAAPRQQNFFADSKQSRQRRSAPSSGPASTTPAKNSTGSTSDPIDLSGDTEADDPVLQSILAATSPNEPSVSPSGVDAQKTLLYASLLAQVEQKEAEKGLTNQYDPSLADTVGHLDFETHFGLCKPGKDIVNGLHMTHIVIEDWESSFLTLPTLFEDASPHWIVLYDPDPGIVRQVECYKASRPGWFVRLYMLVYKESVEEQKFLELIARESNVLLQIIKNKSTMVSLDEESEADIISKTAGTSTGSSRQGQNAPSALPSAQLVLGGGILSTSVDTSGISAALQPVQQEVVIVDLREFRSKLPGMLHQHGITIQPETLVIADYILSPDIAVERKSLPDLRQSFRSGHLYNQIESLERIYPKPVLLIEFDSSEPFELTSSDDLQSGKFGIHDLRSQLALLTKNFPKLRVCWSRSPSQTAQLFLALKRGKLQPNAASVSFIHSNFSSSTTSHTEHDDIAELDEGEGKTKRGRRARTNAAESSSDVGHQANTVGQYIAPFAPIDILKRISPIERESKWKPLLYPSEARPASPPVSASKGASVFKSRSSPPKEGSALAASPPKDSPPKAVAPQGLDGSLFEVDSDEEDPYLLAPRALPPRASSSVASTDTSPPRQHTAPFRGCSSLAALAALSEEQLLAVLGPTIGNELQTFLHRRYEANPLDLAPQQDARGVPHPAQAKRAAPSKRGRGGFSKSPFKRGFHR